jgi:hypothetical protein
MKSTAQATPSTPVATTPKVTKVDARVYTPSSPTAAHSFKSAQRTITYAALMTLGSGTIEQVAKLADEAGLKSKTPTIASVRFHLHYLCLDGYVTWA